MKLQSGKRTADATYRSNTHFPVLPSYFHSALHGCIKYEDDIILLSAHVYLMVLHDLKSFLSFIKQKKKQSETRIGGGGGGKHHLDLNPYKMLSHCV